MRSGWCASTPPPSSYKEGTLVTQNRATDEGIDMVYGVTRNAQDGHGTARVFLLHGSDNPLVHFIAPRRRAATAHGRRRRTPSRTSSISRRRRFAKESTGLVRL